MTKRRIGLYDDPLVPICGNMVHNYLRYMAAKRARQRSHPLLVLLPDDRAVQLTDHLFCLFAGVQIGIILLSVALSVMRWWGR